MIPASVHAEPVHCNPATRATHERLSTRDHHSTRDHVALNYRAIALPALAAAVRHVSELRAARNAAREKYAALEKSALLAEA